MTLCLYLFSFGMLIFFSVLTGELHPLGITKVALLFFMMILGYAALAVGGFMESGNKVDSKRVLRK